MSELITEREFNRALKSLEDLIRAGQQANDAANAAILAQAIKTNGRVDVLERVSQEHAVKIAALVPSGEAVPLTRRDLWVVTGTLGAVGGMATFLAMLWAAQG